VRVAQLSDRGGILVGALTVDEEDEVMVVMEKGKIVRSRVDEVRRTGRNTMGVQFATPDTHDSIVAVARNADRRIEVVVGDLEVSNPDVPLYGQETDVTLVTEGDAPLIVDSASEGPEPTGSVASEPDGDDNVGGGE
jgi:DNA gyrase subunit A